MKKDELVKLLDGMSMMDVVQSDEFSEALQRCLDVEFGTLDKVRREAARQGRRIRSNPIDKLKDVGAWNVSSFKELFIAIVDKRCLLPSSLRDYIRQVCIQAYSKALKEIIDKKRKEKKDE